MDSGARGRRRCSGSARHGAGACGDVVAKIDGPGGCESCRVAVHAVAVLVLAHVDGHVRVHDALGDDGALRARASHEAAMGGLGGPSALPCVEPGVNA